MPEFLWQKDDAVTDEQLMNFMAGEDVLLDRVLFPFDIRASRAHAVGLARIGLLNDQELAAISRVLDQLGQKFENGEFVLDERFEDGHSAIEHFLTEQLGETGKKIHTGRSRNDQVLVATRLFLIHALTRLDGYCREIAREFLVKAKEGEHTPMPGYTHLQHAMVSSAGLWFAAFAEAFIDDAMLARQTRKWLDCNPLGTAAGFGVNIALDRELTTRELGFARLQLNPMYAQNSRGKFELQALSAFWQAALDLRRFAWDLSLFVMPECGYVILPERYTTGSSIMPNKRNPDVIELLRGVGGVIQGAMTELNSLLSLPSGYHRDLQLTKAPVLRAINRALAALQLLPELVSSLRLDEERLAKSIEPEMYATDRALELVGEGVAFRDAYRQALDDEAELARRTPVDSVRQRISPGAPGNLGLPLLKERLRALDESK